jgi:hypothetical protein
VWTNIVKNEHGSRLSEVTDCRQKDWDSFVNRDVGISLFTSSSFLSGPATDVVLYPAVIGDTFVVVCNIYWFSLGGFATAGNRVRYENVLPGRKEERKRLGCGPFYDNTPYGPVFEPATSRTRNMSVIRVLGVSFPGINRHTSKAYRSIHFVGAKCGVFSTSPIS